MSSTDTDRLQAMALRLERLDAAQAARNTLGRYMQLCDVPCGDCGALGLADLFSDDAVWEGVGPLYAGKFGRHRGPAAIAAFVGSYLAPSPHFTRNLHFLTSEQLDVDADCRRARGRWLMLQLSTYGAGGAEAITARLAVDFVPGPDGRWLIAHFRTERLECAPWHDGAAREVAS